MAKTIIGAALISYGPVLPAASTSADGSLFYKTNDAGTPQGLYVYGYTADSNLGAYGPQVAQVWTPTVASGTFVSKIGDTMTGPLTVAYSGGPGITLQSSAPGIRFTETDAASGSRDWLVVTDGATFQIQARNDSFSTVTNTPLSLSRGGTLLVNGSPVWTQANDGAGSGLDADLLDGNDSSFFRNLNNMNAGYLSVGLGGTGTSTFVVGGIPYGTASTNYGFSAAGTAGQLLTSGGTGAPVWINQSSLTVGNATNATNATYATSSGNSATTSQTTFGRVRTDGINRGSYGSISISAGDGGYAGIDFTTQAVTLMVQNSGAIGFYKDNSTWVWYVDSSGALSAGSVPYSRVTGAPTDLAAYSNGPGYITASALTPYVAKAGDTMTGSLAVPTLAVGAVSMPAAGSLNVQGNITTFGFTSTVGNVVSSSGALISTNSYVQAGAPGTTGYIRMQSPGSANSGYVEFYGSNQIRSGYIGNTTSAGSTDLGTITYVAGSHGFSGSITSTGNVTAYSSDGRLKKNLVIIPNAVQKVLSLGGYSYDWDMAKCAEVGFSPANEHEHGLVAQDVQKVMPDAVAPAPFNDKYLTVRYERIVALLTAAMAEQQAQIEALVARINVLEDK